MTKHKAVRIPKPLVDIIDIIIEKYPELGYNSHNEFIIESIEHRVELLSEFSDKSD
ncbi:MAG: hypothetical protein P8Y70_20950 [Candidatus Lokiarchaeota archaeon]